MDPETNIIITLVISGIFLNVIPAFLLLFAARIAHVDSASYMKCFMTLLCFFVVNIIVTYFIERITFPIPPLFVSAALMLYFLLSMQVIFFESFMKIFFMWLIYLVLRVVLVALVILSIFHAIPKENKIFVIRHAIFHPADHRIFLELR